MVIDSLNSFRQSRSYRALLAWWGYMDIWIYGGAIWIYDAMSFR